MVSPLLSESCRNERCAFINQFSRLTGSWRSMSAPITTVPRRPSTGERPFVCLICLSAFTTKANCERHLKVHTDTLNGVCHGCGFVSTTRDILYSHLVTSHMVCQPGSRSEVYSPGPGLPKLPISTGKSCVPCDSLWINLHSDQSHFLKILTFQMFSSVSYWYRHPYLLTLSFRSQSRRLWCSFEVSSVWPQL